MLSDASMIFDRETGLLWDAKPDTSTWYFLSDVEETVKEINLSGLDGWKLPTKEAILSVAKNHVFPLRTGENFLLLEQRHWLVSLGVISLFEPHLDLGWDEGHLIACNDFVVKSIKNKTAEDSLIIALKIFSEKGWNFCPHGQHHTALIKSFQQDVKTILALVDKTYDVLPELNLDQVWQGVDYLSTRLPKIDQLRFSDADQGMWEFYQPGALKNKYSSVSSERFYRERNPVLDIQHANVAIDFGTSSTVVAIRSNGKDELLRIGMQEKHFAQDELKDEQFENPTVLEFIDINQFLDEWQSEVYRPLVNWDNIHCSHEARMNLRNNDTDSKVVSSILMRLKQWALRDEQHSQVCVKDQQEFEYRLSGLSEYNPVKGNALALGDDYPELDPIEVYAWFLGMNINWRARGIFLNYYLTFPVEYPNQIKAKILASFRRGLQRSLPESLLYAEEFNDFSVEELASEPAAFAASALERLEIEPEEGGVSYAVFDFGGGTTDFDYGYYRTPTQDEYDEGWDHVIEHFGSSGDKFLGGENLLENLAYLVFRDNSSECRKKGIVVSKPIDAEPFAGSELLIAKTQAAYTNTTLMMSKLRPLWKKVKWMTVKASNNSS